MPTNPTATIENWTPIAKRRYALSMLKKGQNFLGAAVLLRGQGGYEWVVLHLACQGLEIVLKAVLLLKDFDRYKEELRKFGHNLESVTAEVLAISRLHPIRAELASELRYLNSFYARHLLRYGSFFDILIDPREIQSDRILRRITAGLRLIDRELDRATKAANARGPRMPSV